jgi:hypothetical protein
MADRLVSLDPDDNDPARFWRYVVAALDRVCEGLGDRLCPLLTGTGSTSSLGMVTALINQIEALNHVSLRRGARASRCARCFRGDWSPGDPSTDLSLGHTRPSPCAVPYRADAECDGEHGERESSC